MCSGKTAEFYSYLNLKNIFKFLTVTVVKDKFAGKTRTYIENLI